MEAKMIDLDTFKTRCGVTKNKYVENWLKEELIPGSRSGPSIEDARFPNSARRPYRYRAKVKHDAINIRTHIVNACIRREHITYKMCHMTEVEFSSAIEDLVKCGLVSIRIEDGIPYYDSTAQCDSLKGKPLKAIRKFILDAIEAIARGYAGGVIGN